MIPPRTKEILDFNVRYHDAAALDYDSKWGIGYESLGRAQVLGKVERALGHAAGRYERSLEIGAGTGYFTLNLLRAGVVSQAVATDVSDGMLEALGESAKTLGVNVETVNCEAAELPFADDSFDLVLGHAVLHHLPDLDAAFREFQRVLRPGGTLVFCGEPSRHGDRLAAWPKRAAVLAAPLWRRLMGASERRHGHDHHAGGPGGDHGLEFAVDVHAFTPRDLNGYAERAGFDAVRVSGEELVASLFGWANRTLEGTAEPDEIPVRWYRFAHRGYLALQKVDRVLFEQRLPAALFYNLLISAQAPAAPREAPRPTAAAAA